MDAFLINDSSFAIKNMIATVSAVLTSLVFMTNQLLS